MRFRSATLTLALVSIGANAACFREAAGQEAPAAGRPAVAVAAEEAPAAAGAGAPGAIAVQVNVGEGPVAVAIDPGSALEAAEDVAVEVAPVVAAPEPDPQAEVTIDQQTFDHYFSFGFGADVEQTFDRGTAEIELKLREIAADKTVTADQLDRIRMAGYAEKAAQARVQLTARRAIIGKKYPDIGHAYSAYNQVLEAGRENQRSKSKMMVVYVRVLTDQQKLNHQLFRAKRRDRFARASILHRVALLSQQVAMTQQQRLVLAKLINEQMPPAGLYDDAYTSSVISYAMALVPSEELGALLDEGQMAALKSVFESGAFAREELRRSGALDRITAYRAAAERAAEGATEDSSAAPSEDKPTNS
jgi:hypothetical protein